MDGDAAEQSPQQGAQPLAEFRARLAALTPRIVVTPALVGLNVLVFLVMVASGVHPLSPTVESLVAWGANFGPLSAGGQWWRLCVSDRTQVDLRGGRPRPPSVQPATVPNPGGQRRGINWLGESIRPFVQTRSAPDAAASGLGNHLGAVMVRRPLMARPTSSSLV